MVREFTTPRMAIGTRASCQSPSGACARLPNSPPLSRIDQIERDRPATTLAAWLTKKSQPSPRGRCRGRDRASVIESHSGLPDDIGTAPPVLKDRDRNKFTRFLFVPSPRRGGLGRGDEWQIDSTSLPPPQPSPPRGGRKTRQIGKLLRPRSQVGWLVIRRHRPRDWSRLNGVRRDPLRGTSCRSGNPAASMTWTRQHGSPDPSGIRNRESRTSPPCECRGFGRRPVERADDDRGGCAAPRLSESAFSHPHSPARISRAGLFSCAASSKMQPRSRSPAFHKAGLLFVGRCSNKTLLQ